MTGTDPMIEQYTIDKRKEFHLVRQVRTTTRKWKIGNTLAIIFAIIGIGLAAAVVLSGSVHGAEMVASLVAVLLFPLLGVLLSSAIARTGGRDILLNRINERVYMDGNEFVESYTPRFRQLDPSALIENHILYSDITDMVHKKRTCQYVLHGKVATVRRCINGNVETKENGTIVLYDYFADMEAMLADLEKYSGHSIKEEE